MSLINEALKRAQRTRSAGSGDFMPPTPGGDVRVARRRPPLSAKFIVLYASGGLLLFVLAVVGTVYVLNRPATPVPSTIPEQAGPVVRAQDAASPMIVLPSITPRIATNTPPVPAAEAAEKSSPISAAAAVSAPSAGQAPQAAANPVSALAAPPSPATAPVTTASPPDAVATLPSTASPQPVPTAPVADAPALPLPDERIYLFLDNLRVTAVRLQGDDSRVMVNDRVYRLHDIIDRPLALRLTKVTENQLTFTDANGVSYLKYF